MRRWSRTWASWGQVRKEVLRWIVFTGFFSLLPIIGSYVVLVVSHRGNVSDWYAPLEGGELLLISAVVAVDGIGEALASVHKGESKIYAVAGAILILVCATMWYATLASTSGRFEQSASPSHIVAVSTSVDGNASLELPGNAQSAVTKYTQSTAQQGVDYLTVYGSLIFFVATLGLGTYCKILGCIRDVSLKEVTS